MRVGAPFAYSNGSPFGDFTVDGCCLGQEMKIYVDGKASVGVEGRATLA